MAAFLIVMGISLLPLAIIGMIIFAAVNKDKPDAYKTFSSGVKTIFSYIFIIFALFAIIFGTIFGINGISNYCYPDTIEIVADTEQTDEDYSTRDSYKSDMPAGLRIQNDKNEALAEAAGAFSMAIIAIPVFIYYNKQVKDTKKTKK